MCGFLTGGDQTQNPRKAENKNSKKESMKRTSVKVSQVEKTDDLKIKISNTTKFAHENKNSKKKSPSKEQHCKYLKLKNRWFKNLFIKSELKRKGTKKKKEKSPSINKDILPEVKKVKVSEDSQNKPLQLKHVFMKVKVLKKSP